MALLWKAVSTILTFEIIVLLILCAPLPWGVRKNISRWIFRANALNRLNMMFKYVFFSLTLALLDSISSLRKAQKRARVPAYSSSTSSMTLDGVHSGHSRDERRWLQTRAERNFYLASFTIITLIAITRLVKLASIEVQLREKIKHYNGNKPITETGETVIKAKN